jgi:hypothetical protein
MRKYILLTDLANAYPILVSIYPDIFIHQEKKLQVLLSPTLERVLERIDDFKSLLPMSKDLILMLYGDEKSFYINKERKNPLEQRILRMDRGLGNPIDMYSLAVDMNISVDDNINEQIYRQLHYDVLVSVKGPKFARQEMNKFIKETLR